MVALFLCCSEPRQRVGLRVIFPADVFHRYLFESSNEVGEHMIILLQQRFLHLKVFLDLTDHQLGVAFERYLVSSHAIC